MRKGPLGIAVSCEGEGVLQVRFAPSGLSFPLSCVSGDVSTTYNQIDLKYDRDPASLEITAPSPVRWSLTVGQQKPGG
ncbi:hypothetical protein C6N75_22920 [Streptomyces solincola]|uniref:Uncharacterized protein n=1 Tax=Streptomyces solincola TaxID=2100817 RepID=A0A2S9PRC1_9ACTN|nr:hypothetical protein C6N75_22920 [Streptomyces solincola]